LAVVVLGFELRATSLLRKCSTMPLALFAFIIFHVGFLIFAWGQVQTLPTYASHLASITDTYHQARFLLL
jgi:hypothetical protein